MRKEVIVAIILGVFLGLVIAFGIYRTNRSIDNKITNNIPFNNNPQEQEVDNKPSEELKITITQPENLDGIIENPINLSGITLPQALVVVSGENEDIILRADNTGVFETPVNLLGGVNNIIAKSFDNISESNYSNVTLIYSSEFIKQLKSELVSNNSTSSATIEDAVNEKVELTKADPRVYLGSITDVTEGTIQIKNQDSEIQLVSTDDKTTYARLGKTTTELKSTDVAIGDYVAVLGTINGQKVLKARRVLLTNPIEPPLRKIFRANVEKYSKKSLTILYEEDSYTLTYDKNIKVTTSEDAEIVKSAYTDIENGDDLIIVGEIKDTTITARRLHIIKPIN